jgi:membrane-bound ClpP family serine protease
MENIKKQAPSIILIIAGAALNLASVFSNDNGALVAVGCSLFVVGVAMARKNQQRQNLTNGGKSEK